MDKNVVIGSIFGVLLTTAAWICGSAAINSQAVSSLAREDVKTIAIVVKNQEDRLKTIETILAKAIQESQKTEKAIIAPVETNVLPTELKTQKEKPASSKK